MVTSRCAALAVLFLSLPDCLAAANRSPETPPKIVDNIAVFDGIDGRGSRDQAAALLLHQRNLRRAPSRLAPVSQDVGDVAVIVDNGSIVYPAQPAVPFAWNGTALSFSGNGGGTQVAASRAALDPVLGTALTLGDDTTAVVPLGFSFPFFGVAYDRILVNSNGNITFGAAFPWAAYPYWDPIFFLYGPPRVAALYADFNPAAGGTVYADVRGDRVVVTWKDVPEYGTSNASTFQITLRADGAITIAYGAVAVPYGIAGVTPGDGRGELGEIEPSRPRGVYRYGAAFAEFHPGYPKQIDIYALAQEFYRTHPDVFDFLVSYTNFSFAIIPGHPGVVAFNQSASNATQGIGQPTFDVSGHFGSGGELESFLNMNDVRMYWSDEDKMLDPPLRQFPTYGYKELASEVRTAGVLPADNYFGVHAGLWTSTLLSPISTLAHEVGHRWLAWVPFVHPTKGVSADSWDLLFGPGNAHWSQFANTAVPAEQFPDGPRAASNEGNALLDLGTEPFMPEIFRAGCTLPGEHTFRSDPQELTDGYSALDQYLMGLRLANQVGGFWYIDEPRDAFSGASLEGTSATYPLRNGIFCGKRVDLTVADIAAYPGVGPRVPEIGDEVDTDELGNPALDVKTMAFLLLVEQGDPNSPSLKGDIGHVDSFRRLFEAYANGPATGWRGRFDTSLRPRTH